MPTPPFGPSHKNWASAKDAHDLRAEGVSVSEIAGRLGFPRTTVGRWVQAYEEYSSRDPAIADIMEGVGTGLVPRNAWLRTKTASGDSVCVQLQPPEADPVDYAEKIREKLEGLPAAPEIILRDRPREGMANLLATSDWHLGAVISEGTTHRPYSRDIAIKRLKEGYADLQESLQPAEVAVVHDNGDRLHANDDRDVTVKSSHKLKVEGSHHENTFTSVEVACWQIELALTRHDHVIFSMNPGNHDPNAPAAVLAAMRMRYANNPRVTIEARESHYSLFRWGRVFLAGHHGHGQKVQAMCESVKFLFRRDYGQTDFHHFYTGHLHSFKEETIGGLMWTQLPSLCSTTQHEQEMGFVDTSGIYGASFCKERGRRTSLYLRV